VLALAGALDGAPTLNVGGTLTLNNTGTLTPASPGTGSMGPTGNLAPSITAGGPIPAAVGGAVFTSVAAPAAADGALALSPTIIGPTGILASPLQPALISGAFVAA
jgi:hypothetical protein